MDKAKGFNLFLRVILLFIGTFIATIGIALVTLSDLGTTPVSTVPYVFSVITGYSFGQATFAVNIFFVLGQILLLRKKFPIWNLLQIPLVGIFSYFIDISMGLFSWLDPQIYWERLFISVAGNAVLAAGVLMQVRSKTMVQPGEGIVLAIAVTFRRKFSTMKIGNDVSLVIIAIGISLIVLGHTVGVREGTLISAVAVGLFIKLYEWILARLSHAPRVENKEPNTLFEKDRQEKS